MRPVLLLLAFVLPWAGAASGADDGQEGEGEGDEADGVDDGDLSVLLPVLRASPGRAFAGVAAGQGLVYVVEVDGAVRVSRDRGRRFLHAPRWQPPAGPGPLLPALEEEEAEDEDDDDAADDDGDAGAFAPTDPFQLQERYGYVGENVWLDLDRTWFFRQSAADLFAFPYGTTGEPYLEFQPDSPAFWDAPWVSGMPRPDVRYYEPLISAPLLGARHASRGGTDPIPAQAGFAVVVDAHDPGRAFVSSASSVEHTEDGGASWSVLQEWAWDDVGGALLAVRGDLIVATGAGALVISRDGGARFTEVDDVDGVVAAAFDPLDAGGLWVATNDGVLRSDDGGRTFSEANALAPAALVTGGEGRVVVAAGRRVLQSNDGGASFTAVVDADDDVIGLALDGAVLHVLTAGALSRVVVDVAAVDDAALRGLRRAWARAPTLAQTLAGAHQRLSPTVNDGGSPGFFPRVDLVGGAIAGDSTAVLDAVFLDSTTAGDGDFVRQTAERVTEDGKGAAFRRRQPSVNPYVAISLSWDLPSLFAPASSPARRAEAHAAFDVVAREIHEAWDARRLALQDLALLPVDDEQTLLRRSLDLAELNARLEVLSGVPFPALGGDAGRALQRLPPSPSALELVDDATTRLGVGAARVQGLAAGAWWRPAWPTVLVSGSFAESRLDEDDFLDEVGLERPWITKSALGQAFDVGARLAWDLPHTLRRDDDVDVGRLAWLRRDVALGVTTAWFERARAQAHRLNATAKSDDDDDDDLAVEELTALLTGLTGRPSLALSPRSPP